MRFDHKAVKLSAWTAGIVLCIVLGCLVGSGQISFLQWTQYDSKALDLVPGENGEVRLKLDAPFDKITGISFVPQLPLYQYAQIIILEPVKEKVIYRSKKKELKPFISLGHAVSVEKNRAYEIRIMPEDPEAWKNKNPSGVRVYGYNVEYWWICFYSALFLTGFLFVLWADHCRRKGCLKDRERWIIAGGMFYASLFLLLLIHTTMNFEDTLDNMYGGLLIAGGKSLYRDYITQHMPMGYYLCAFYALLGARSAGQFEVLFYLTQALAYGLFCLRYLDERGKKILIFPLAEIVIINSVNCIRGMVLAENIMEFAMFFMVMELAGYLKDRRVTISRSIIVGACGWISVFSVFLSLFPAAFCALMFICFEIRYWSSEEGGGFALSKAWVRYRGILGTALLIPAAVLAFFAADHSLEDFFRNAYLFNREVYPQYNGGMGDSLLQPVLNCFVSFARAVVSDFGKASDGIHSENYNIATALVACAFLFFVVRNLAKRKYIAITILFLGLVVLNCTRTDWIWHNTPAWGIALLYIASYGEIDPDVLLKYKKILIGALALFLAGMIVLPLLPKQVETELKEKTIHEADHGMMRLTEPGDEVFIDGLYCNPLYVLACGRKPVNRLIWFHPWYLDWYEEEMIALVDSRRAKALVLDPDQDIWGYQYYMEDLRSHVEENYAASKEIDYLWESASD